VVLRDKVEIKSSVEAVWPYISDQVLYRKWNGGARAIVPISAGEWTAGAKWRVRYVFRGRESNYLAEALEFERPARLVIHLTGGNLSRDGYIQEIYELSMSSKGNTVVKQSIVLYKSGVNLLSTALLFLSHNLFRPRRKRYLLRLKELVEGG